MCPYNLIKTETEKINHNINKRKYKFLNNFHRKYTNDKISNRNNVTTAPI